MPPRTYLPSILFLILTLGVKAQLFVEGGAVYSRVHTADMNGKRDPTGGALDLGWRFSEQHAAVLRLQSSRWSGAYQEEYYTVYGSGYDNRNFRTTLETVALGYRFTRPLTDRWSWQITPAIGVGRLKTDYDSTPYKYTKVEPTVRVRLREASRFCVQLTTGFQWRVSERGYLQVTTGVLQKNRDPETERSSDRLWAVQFATGLGVRF